MRKLNLRIYLLLLVSFLTVSQSSAQTASGGGNGMLSAYSRYGFGQLTVAAIGRQSAMGGVGLALRDGTQVNVSNPASYSKCDSLTFLLDAGVSLENGNFDNGSNRMNVKSGSFDYIVMQFRAFKNIGVSFGFIPYSKVGYNFATSHTAIDDKYGSVIPYSTFEGSGGLSMAYLGVGAKIWKGLSVGANFNYLFGNITHTVTNQFSESAVYSSVRNYSADIRTLKLDLGLQYEQALNKHDRITVGAILGLGHEVDNDATRTDYTYDSSTSTVEGSSETTLSKAFELPGIFGVGVAYQHGTKLLASVDYTCQKFGSVKYPMTTNAGYVSQKGFLSDRNKVAAGVEYTPNAMSRKYLKRVHYRLGGHYSTPYARVDGNDGAKEYGLSAGFGLPIQNQWNNKSVVNISAQWVHVAPGSHLKITENYLRVVLGITFDERMFAKWKVN